MDENCRLLDSPSSSSTTFLSPSPTLSTKPFLTSSNTSESNGCSLEVVQIKNFDFYSDQSLSPMSSGGIFSMSGDDEHESGRSSYSGHLVNAEDLQFRTACLLILVLIIVDLVLLSVNPALLRIEFHATWLQKMIILCSALAVLAYGLADQLLFCLRNSVHRKVEQAVDLLFFAVLYLSVIPTLVVIIAYELLYLMLQLGGYVPMGSRRS